MSSLRERFIELFPGPKLRQRYVHATEALLDVYERRNLLGARSLTEYDSHTLDNMIRHLNDIDLTGTLNDTGEPDEVNRRKAVDESRYLYHYDPVTRHSIRLWANFGLGTDPQVIIKDKEGQAQEQGAFNSAAAVFSECWNARRNAPLFKRRRINRMSDKVMTDGELFFAAFYETKEQDNTDQEVADDLGIDTIPKGGSTIRLLDTKQITELVSDPQDAETICYYKREWYDEDNKTQKTVYYESWDAHKAGATKRAKLPDGAEVESNCFVLHAEHNTIGLRGWPITSTNASWLRAYKKFMQDRVTIAASKAMFVRQLSVEGGSRAVEAMRSFFASTLQGGGDEETNPAAVAGSSLVTNKAVDYKDIPLTTGAGDAQADGAAIIAQAGLGFGVFPHFLGRGESFRLATACYSEDTEVLTETGWKHYSDWHDGERIASYNTVTRALEYVVPTALHVYPYTGKMLRIKGRGINALVTPNHRMWALNQNNQSKAYAKTSFEVIEAQALPSRFALPTQAHLQERPTLDSFILPGYRGENGRQYPAKIIPMNDWLQFLGWWLAEGDIDGTTVGVCQIQSATENVQELDALFARLPFVVTRGISKKGLIRWRITSKQLAIWIKEHCGQRQPSRRLPDFVFALNAEQASILLDAIWKGDGHTENAEHFKGVLTSTSKELLDGCQVLLLHCGAWGGIALQREAGAKKDMPNSSACWVLYRSTREQLSLSRKRTIREVDYTGTVWCFEVPPNGMFITRRNGQPLIAGNTAMETPVLRTWAAYQQWWADVLTDLANMIIGIWEEVNGTDLPEYEVGVQIDPLIETDVAELSAALVALSGASLVPQDPAMLLALQMLKVPNAEQIVADAIKKREEQKAEQEAKSEAKAQPALPEEMAEELRLIGRLAREMLAEGKGGEAARELAVLAGESTYDK